MTISGESQGRKPNQLHIDSVHVMAYQEPHTFPDNKNKKRHVLGDLAGDLTAAAVSATLIAPTVTIIDR